MPLLHSHNKSGIKVWNEQLPTIFQWFKLLLQGNWVGLGQIRLGQVRLGQVRLGQVPPTPYSVYSIIIIPPVFHACSFIYRVCQKYLAILCKTVVSGTVGVGNLSLSALLARLKAFQQPWSAGLQSIGLLLWRRISKTTILS